MSYALWWIMHYEVMRYDLFNCICLATPNGWETSQQVRLYHPPMALICIDNDT